MIDFNILYTDINEDYIKSVSDLVYSDEDEQDVLNNIMSKLESMQITFTLTDITVLQYMMIASIKRLETSLEIDYTNPRFVEFESDDDYLNDMYDDLVHDTKEYMKKIVEDAKGVNGVSEDFCRYVSTTGQLCNITIYTNGKKFLRLLSTLMKYDELTNIVEAMTNRDTENELIANSFYLSNMVDSYEIYLRGSVDEVVRGDLIDEMDEDGVSVVFETNLRKLVESKKNGVDIGKVATTSYVVSTILAYQELLKSGYSDRVRMENLFHVLSDERESKINLALPHQLYNRPYISQIMDLAIKWCELIERCMDKDKYGDKIYLNLIPNSLTVTYRYICKLENDENETINMYGFEEIANIQVTRKRIISEALFGN